ncbi:type II secretion system protein GspG [Coraliomargarita sinensis]|uniref:Type II secretion system protein GspG n=1 Tax=Coraliomargarita sinensis TaxID=2174842 RepID=A0A317ZFX0_9BACT|nr:type II secretion system major pseudopilin GspG [Coraliomargarita sinensis]PXA04514.1 type II secretion system protein GspG [Coraliomargarita sinensis]
MQTRLQRNRKQQAGFSLIEILIVIALIAILVTVTIGNLDNIFGGQQEKVAGIFVSQTAKIGFQAYKLDVGNYPSTEEGISALVKAPAGKDSRWKGPYLEEVPLDPWGNAYQYRFPGSKNINGARGYDIWSLGPDGVESADDIGNWK